MSEFNPGTIPNVGSGGGLGSGGVTQEDVLQYVKEFNRLVLTAPGGRPDVNREDGSIFTSGRRSAIQLSEEQRRLAAGFFPDPGPIRNIDTQRRFIEAARFLLEAGVGRDNESEINLFLELVESALVSDGGADLREALDINPDEFGFTRNRRRASSLGGSTLSKRQINRALDQYYENLDQNVENRALQNEEAFTAIVQRQQGLLSILTPSILQSGFVNLFYRDIYQIEAEDSSTFLSLFTNKPDYQSWFSAPSVILSCITPKIRIYKQYNTSDGEKVNVEFEFPNKMDSENIRDIAAGNGRGGGYGIKSFSWDYEGQNPFEISRSIKAKLELYIQDLSKLFPPAPADISNEQVRFRRGNEATQQGYIFELFRLVRRGEQGDLVSYPENSEVGSFIDPYDYRLKIDVAWNFDRNTLTNLGPEYEKYIGFFEEAVKTLDLGLEAHDINFNQDGSIGISLSYRSFLDSLLQNSDFYNILSIGDQRLLDRINHIRQRGGEIDAAARESDSEGSSSPCQQTESVLSDPDDGERRINTNTKIFQNLIEVDYNDPNNIIANYSSIFNTLIEQSRIYVLGFDFGNLADSITVQGVEAIVDNTEGEIVGEEREAYLRIVQNELTLEFIKNQEFNVGRLTKDGVLFLQEQLSAQQAALAEQIQTQEQEGEVSLAFNLEGQTPLSLLNTPTTSVEANPYTEGAEQTGRYVRTYFTTLGDIIQAVMGELADANVNFRNNIEIEDFPYLISGPYLFKDVEGRNILINLSNILIDIDAFRKFFTEKIMSGLATSYTLETFIKEMYSYFCYETNARAALQGASLLSSRSRLFYNSFSKTSKETENELLIRFLNYYYSSTTVDLPFSDFFNLYDDSTKVLQLPVVQEVVNRGIEETIDLFKPKILNVEEFFKQSNENMSRRETSGDFAVELLETPKTYNYIYITANPVQLVAPDGVDFDNGYDYSVHREKDNERNIFHLTFGEKNSIIKNLTFQKFDDPSLRTARTIGEGADNLNYLRELYNVNLSLIGTPFLMPGQYLYLNPIFMGAGEQARDISEFLGFGGYYVVLNTVNKIDANHNYTTECKLHWQSFGRQRDEDLCFLQRPLTLYSEDAVELATVELTEIAAADGAREELKQAILAAGGDPNSSEISLSKEFTGGIQIYDENNQNIMQGIIPANRIRAAPGTQIPLRVSFIISFDALNNGFVAVRGDEEFDRTQRNPQGQARDVTINTEAMPLEEFLINNASSAGIQGVVSDLQAIQDAAANLQAAQSQLENEND